MKKKDIIQMYRDWRKANNNRKPNRVIVKMFWEDGDNTEKGYQIDTIAMNHFSEDDDKCVGYVLWCTSGINGLWQLTKPDNGSDFVVQEILEFYKA